MTRDFLFLLLLASLATACFRNDKDIPALNYNPHVLKPERKNPGPPGPGLQSAQV